MVRQFARYSIPLVLALWSSTSCTFSEPRIRAEPVILQSSGNTQVYLDDYVASFSNPTAPLQTRCEESAPWMERCWGTLTGSIGDECVYTAVTEESLNAALLSSNQAVRDRAIITVLALSDRNCNNFRAKVFAFRTGANFAGGFLNTVLSGTSAITALASGPAASGLSAANTVIGSGLSGINSSYYANKILDQIDAEIQIQRAQMQSQILARIPSAAHATQKLPAAPNPEDFAVASTPTATATPVPVGNSTPSAPYSGLDAKLDLQAYDNICSLENITHPSPSPTSTPSPTATPGTPTATATPTPTPKPHKKKPTPTPTATPPGH